MIETKVSEQITSHILSLAVIDAVLEKKAKDVVMLDLRDLAEAVCDYFIVCHGTSTTQVKAIGDYASYDIKNKLEEYPISIEGTKNAEWVLVDYGNVVLHVFIKEKRDFYQLEELWSDAHVIHYSEDGQESSPDDKSE